MDETMALMIRNPEEPRNQSISTAITLPSWKLYENPFYDPQQQQQQQQQRRLPPRRGRGHILHLPVSARKIAPPPWDRDPSIFRPMMDSELKILRAQIAELKLGLQREREARENLEYINKRLAKELSEERRGRGAVERVCDVLAMEIASNKAEIDRMRREMEEERKMLRMAEVLREEKIQMELTEAKILMEEKLVGFQYQLHSPSQMHETKAEEDRKNISDEVATSMTSSKYYGSSSCNSNIANSTTLLGFHNGDSSRGGRSIMSSNQNQRRASAEVENPHIKRGIKGFVEFPKVVRANGPRGRHLSTMLECQKAQLRLLLRHRSPIRSHNLIRS